MKNNIEIALPYDIYLSWDLYFMFELFIWMLLAIVTTKCFNPLLMKLNLNWKKIVGVQLVGYLIIIFLPHILIPHSLELILFDGIDGTDRYGEFMGYVFCRGVTFYYCIKCALSWLVLIAIPALHSWKMKMSYYIIPLAIFITPFILLITFCLLLRL